MNKYIYIESNQLLIINADYYNPLLFFKSSEILDLSNLKNIEIELIDKEYNILKKVKLSGNHFIIGCMGKISANLFNKDVNYLLEFRKFLDSKQDNYKLLNIDFGKYIINRKSESENVFQLKLINQW